MIQSLGGSTPLDAYELAIGAENNLIDARKLPLRPPMPIFQELTSQSPDPPSPSTSTPPSMYTYLNAQQAGTSTLAPEVNDMKNLLRTFSNEIINLKRQQAPQKPPFQNYKGRRPPCHPNWYKS